MVGAAGAAITRRAEGAELVFELSEATGVMHLALRIAHRDGLGAHRLTAARCDKPHRRHIGIGGMDGGAHHLAAEIRFRDDAIGTVFVKRRAGTAPPDGGLLAARAISNNIAIAIGAARRNDEADLIGARSSRPAAPEGSTATTTLTRADPGISAGAQHVVSMIS